MKVMLDTNILISTIYNPVGSPAYAYVKASTPPYSLVLCDQIIDELRRIFNRKFPTKIPLLDQFLSIAHYDLITITSQDIQIKDEDKIRDIKDRPILRAANKAEVHILVTGDKGFLESGIIHPEIMTASEFIKYNFLK